VIGGFPQHTACSLLTEEPAVGHVLIASCFGPDRSYEAWVIYNFMALCMAFVGGPSAVVIKSDGKLIQPSWILCTCCMKPIAVDGFFLRNCKQVRYNTCAEEPLVYY
jgi:hypothetical protein